MCQENKELLFNMFHFKENCKISIKQSIFQELKTRRRITSFRNTIFQTQGHPEEKKCIKHLSTELRLNVSIERK